jgi:eukaryotic-like serine/threonine-protein kinase
MPVDTELPTSRSIGNYELLEKIAEGGMGAVYKGRHRGSNQIVAIKIVPPETAKNAILLKRFEMEFRAASVLDHPNIVKALDYNGIGTPFLVMEFVDGESLGQRVERDGAIDEVIAVKLIAQVCDGLHKAHKQSLIHRDVKPDNILVDLDGTAKLTDLGLVKDTEAEQNLTRTGRGLGTPHFMAPEQFRNAKNADVKCDVYSLGATLYMMVTGEIPFAKTNPLDCWVKKTKNDFPPPRKLNPKVSERVDWAICRAMSADPTKRPSTCREFVEDLTGNSAEIHGPPSTAIPRIPIAGDTKGTTDPTPSPSLSIEDVLWYMVYRGPDGQQHTVKGLTSSIRDNIRRDVLGDANAIMVSRQKAGPFQNLKNIPEFRDLLVKPAQVPMTKSQGQMPSPPAPGERTGRLPQPEMESKRKSVRIQPTSKNSAKIKSRPAHAPVTLTLPWWAPWAGLVALAALVIILGILVYQRS